MFGQDETLKGTYVNAEICTQDRFKKWLEEKVEQGFGDYVWKGGLLRRFLVDDVHIHGDVGDVAWNTITVGNYGYYLPLWAVIFIIRTAKTKPLTPKKALKFIEEPVLTEADFGIQFGFNYVDDRVNWQLNPPFGANNKGIEGAYLIPPINDYHSWHVVFPQGTTVDGSSSEGWTFTLPCGCELEYGKTGHVKGGEPHDVTLYCQQNSDCYDKEANQWTHSFTHPV